MHDENNRKRCKVMGFMGAKQNRAIVLINYMFDERFVMNLRRQAVLVPSNICTSNAFRKGFQSKTAYNPIGTAPIKHCQSWLVEMVAICSSTIRLYSMQESKANHKDGLECAALLNSRRMSIKNFHKSIS